MSNLAITSSPHFRANQTTQTIMRDVLIALAPALVAAFVFFGLRAIMVVAVCVAVCVLSEHIYRRLMGLPGTVSDLSAVVTGVLLAYNLPSTIPLWMAAIGSFVAIVIIKQLFGGMGKNFANPAIVGRIVLLISFATPMTNWIAPGSPYGVDAVTTATPLALLGSAATDATTAATGEIIAKPEYMDLLIGRIGGSLGETCAIALLIGFVYLLMRKVITPTTPLVFIGTVFLLSWALGSDPIYHVLSGGLLLGAIFMATDYVTTPTTETGKIIFGVGCGVLTVVIRLYGSYPEGVSFAILLMNIVTPLIDRGTTIKAFGGATAND